jgi:hypothetical protein
MTSDLQNRPPAPKVGKIGDNHNSRYHLSRSVGPLPTAHWREFSVLETEDPSLS